MLGFAGAHGSISRLGGPLCGVASTVANWPSRAKAELKLSAVNRSSKAGRQSKF